MKKYYVGTIDYEPKRIMFNEIDAFVSGYDFIDVFNEDGELIQSFVFEYDQYVEIRK